MSLRIKANLLFVVATLLMLCVALPALRAAVRHAAQTAALREASLLTAEADVAERYTREQVAPMLGDDSAVFVPPGSPFFAVETQNRMLQAMRPGDVLRRVVLDPTSDADRPDAWERTVIQRLRTSRNALPFSEIRRQAGGERLVLVTPLRFARGVCATCYTARADAPAGVLDTFGGFAGFNRHQGEIVGLTLASVPVPPAVPGLFHAATAWILAVALVSLVAMNLVLEILVLRPLRRIGAHAEKVSLGAEDVPEFAKDGRDEIAALARSFNRLRRSMESAVALLRP